MKEMYLRLPLIEIGSDPGEVFLAKNYPKSGRYIIRRSNGDITVADVQIREVEIGEARPIDESTLNVCETFVGQPELFDPDDWVLATDMVNTKNAMLTDMQQALEKAQQDYEDRLAEKESEFAERINDEQMRHEAEMAEQKAKCEYMEKTLSDKQAQLDADFTSRMRDLQHDYEMRKQQLELETPKRFAQGEWVSGKTLTEIIKTLASPHMVLGAEHLLPQVFDKKE